MAPVGARPEVPAPACQRFNAPGHPTSAPSCRRARWSNTTSPMPVADSLSDCEEVFTADEPEARSTIPHHLAIAPSCSLLERWWNS